jgi:hypothetical protein
MADTDTQKIELQRIRKWAQDKIDAGSEPPWAWYQYMKLIESIDAILDGMSATITENSQRLALRPGKLLRLVDAKSPQDTSQRHPSGSKIRMPM